MASSPSSTPGKQLRLKDFLKEEENCPSYSCGGASGHRNPPPAGQPEQTVRYLLAMELREGAGGKTPRRRTRAVAALHRITEAINAIMVISPVSFSNGRLRRSSRRKREKERHPKENERITMIGGRNLVQQRSSGKEAKDSADMENLVQFPLSTVRNADSSTSSTGSGGGGGGDWSNTESAESDSSSSPVSPIFCGGDAPTTPTGRREPLAIKVRSSYSILLSIRSSIKNFSCRRGRGLAWHHDRTFLPTIRGRYYLIGPTIVCSNLGRLRGSCADTCRSLGRRLRSDPTA